MTSPTTLGGRLRLLRSLAAAVLDGPPPIAREMSLDVGLSHPVWAQLEASADPNPELVTLKRIAYGTGSTLGWVSGAEGDPPTREAVQVALKVAKRQRAKRDAAKGARRAGAA